MKKERNGEEYVYTDSVFYFSHRVSQLLLEFHAKHFSFILSNDIEIDAYRDFLQPLGSHPLPLNDYLSSQPIKSHEVLTQLYNMFCGRACLVAALTNSEFFHLGTVNELLDLYLNSSSEFCNKFRQTLGFTKFKSSTIDPNAQIHNNCCIINSRLGSRTIVDDGSIIEFCLVGESTRLQVNKNCYLSNCLIDKLDISLKVPENICLHTIPVVINEHLQFVTLFFDRRDDLKKVYAELGQVKFLGREIKESLASILKAKSNRSNCIWDLKLFRAFKSMSESFGKSLEFVNRCLSDNFEDYESQTEFYSLFDLLKYRSYDAMISYRKDSKLY